MADKTLVMEFEDWPDVEVRARLSPVTLDELFTVSDALEAATWRDKATILRLFDTLAPQLVSWRPFKWKPDAAGLAKIDVKLALAIARAWVGEVRSVPLPLLLRSSDGALSADPTTSPES